MSTSRYQPPEWLTHSPQEDLVSTLKLLKTEEEIREFLCSLLTAQEYANISSRWRVTVLFLEGLNGVQIHGITAYARGVISRVNTRIVQGKESSLCRYAYEQLRQHRIDQK